MISLQNSKHGSSIKFENIDFDRYDFQTPMIELNKELKKSSRMIVTNDATVFIIKQSDFKRFSEIMEKTNFGKSTIYDSK